MLTIAKLPYKNQLIKPCEFDKVSNKLRTFFHNKGFVEVHAQDKLSILSACEDPFNIQSFELSGLKWPLPQTGQMILELEMLNDPSVPGYFCLTTSYRDEPNPIEGRHDKVFPLFEFEMKGNMEDLIKLEMELLEYLGYNPLQFKRGKYLDIAKRFNVKELENEHEMYIYDGDQTHEGTPSFFLTDFPEFTSPFWNMKRYNENNHTLSKKVDVILSGFETIGSAEREINPQIMNTTFNSISDGKYKDKIIELFGKERTMNELENFLKLNFIERSGGGIGLGRLIRSMKLEGLL